MMRRRGRPCPDARRLRRSASLRPRSPAPSAIRKPMFIPPYVRPRAVHGQSSRRRRLVRQRPSRRVVDDRTRRGERAHQQRHLRRSRVGEREVAARSEHQRQEHLRLRAQRPARARPDAFRFGGRVAHHRADLAHDAHQQRGEQRVFARKVAVERAGAIAELGAEALHGEAFDAVLAGDALSGIEDTRSRLDAATIPARGRRFCCAARHIVTHVHTCEIDSRVRQVMLGRRFVVALQGLAERTGSH